MTVRRGFFFTAIMIGAVVAGGVIVYQTGIWNRWRAASLAGRANALLAAGMPDAAGVTGAKAVLLDPSNVLAHRVLLGTLRDGDLNGRLLFRSKIADLDRSDRDNLYALAVDALRGDRPLLAGKAVADLGAAEGETGRVLELRMRRAYAAGDLSGAATAARKLLAVAPENEPAQFIVALEGLRSSDPAIASAARAALERFVPSRVHGLEAARALANAAVRSGDFSRAKIWAEKAAASEGAVFADHLAAADVSVRLDAGDAPERCAKLIAAADGDPSNILKLALWLEGIGRTDLLDDMIARSKFHGIAPATAGVLRAQRLVRERRWEELRSGFASENWGGGEPLRLAYLARASRGLGENARAQSAWLDATRLALESPQTARALAGIVRNWPEWRAETEDFLWRAVMRSPANLGWALEALHGVYKGRKSVSGLLRVTAEMIGVDPGNEMLQNNLAFYSLLCRTGLPKAHRLAAELFGKYPADPVVASTYALSALTRGRPDDALAALQKIPPEARANGDVALYYALALAGVGRLDEARTAATEVRRDQLFEEERSLLAAAGL